jgi:hypothetical protein
MRALKHGLLIDCSPEFTCGDEEQITAMSDWTPEFQAWTL